MRLVHCSIDRMCLINSSPPRENPDPGGANLVNKPDMTDVRDISHFMFKVVHASSHGARICFILSKCVLFGIGNMGREEPSSFFRI